MCLSCRRQVSHKSSSARRYRVASLHIAPRRLQQQSGDAARPSSSHVRRARSDTSASMAARKLSTGEAGVSGASRGPVKTRRVSVRTGADGRRRRVQSMSEHRQVQYDHATSQSIASAITTRI